MDLFQIIISVNKISLIAFIAVFIFLIYEIYLLVKEQSFKKPPVIPEFTGTEARPINATMIIKEEKVTHKSNQLLILVLIIMLLFFAAISLISVFSNKQSTKTKEKTMTINKTPSPTNISNLTPTAIINEPTIVPSQAVTPTQILSPTQMLALLISPTDFNSPSPSPTNLPRSLPLTGKTDYIPVIIISSILMFFSLLF